MLYNFKILIPDADFGLALACVHCLTQIKRIKIYAICNENNCDIRYSRYIEHCSFHQGNDTETSRIEKINEEIKKYDIDLIMPISEKGIELIIKNKELINNSKILGLLPSINSFNTAFYKDLFAKHLDKFSVSGPKTNLINPKNDLELETMKINFPAVAKPIEGPGGGYGIVYLKNTDDLNAFLFNKECNTQYIIQEYIEGFDIGCNVLCRQGEIIEFTIQKGNLWNKRQFSFQIGLEFISNEEAFNLVEKLIKSLNWSGFANIDLRYDEKDNSFKILELNPRIWGTLYGSLFAGVNFPYQYCMTSLNIKSEPSKMNYIKFLTLEGILYSLKKNIFFMFNLLFIWNNTPIRYIFIEPKVILFKLIRRFKGLFFRLSQ